MQDSTKGDEIMGWGGNLTDAYKDFTIDIIKGVKMGDEQTTERTLEAPETFSAGDKYVYTVDDARDYPGVAHVED